MNIVSIISWFIGVRIVPSANIHVLYIHSDEWAERERNKESKFN